MTIMPRVAMKGGNRPSVTSVPLHRPAMPPTSNPAATGTMIGRSPRAGNTARE